MKRGLMSRLLSSLGKTARVLAEAMHLVDPPLYR